MATNGMDGMIYGSRATKPPINNVPFRRVLESHVIDKIDAIDAHKLNNCEWYINFIHRCKMNWVFM